MRVLNYHGVLDRSKDETSFSYLFTDVADFHEQVAFLKREARLVSLAEIEASLSDNVPLPDNAVHISFDDGYRNNLKVAEILDRSGIPWSLFVVVNAVLDGVQPWYLRLANAVWATPKAELSDGTVVELGTIWEKRRFAKQAKLEIMSIPGISEDAGVDRLLALRGMQVPEESHWPLLTARELQELHGAGVEIGNHSASHPNLRRCSDNELNEEVAVSRVRLEQAIGSPVRYFAYPDGRHDRRVRRAVGAEHALALATWTLRPARTRLALRRYEPLSSSDLGPLIDKPEPWYGRRRAAWAVPSRRREMAMRIRPSLRQIIPAEASAA